jgi:hypothetical protein
VFPCIKELCIAWVTRCAKKDCPKVNCEGCEFDVPHCRRME